LVDAVKFGIAGYGGRGKVIARRLADLGVEVAGVYDSNPAQLVDVPFRAFSDLDSLFELHLTALVVATWPSSHARIVEAALERDLDVFVEKPMGSTLAESLRIVEAQRRSGRLVVVGYVERLNPAIAKLRDLTDLSDVTRSREIRIGLTPLGKSGGALLDLGSHGLDMAYHLFGDEPRVRSASLTTGQEGKAEYECMVEFDCGQKRCYVEGRHAGIRRRRLELETEQEFYEVTYTPAALKVGFPPPKLRTRPRSYEDLEQLSKSVETAFEVPRKEPINTMLQLTVESFRKGTVFDPLCSGEQALVTARAIDEAKRGATYRFVMRQVTESKPER